MDSIFRSFKPKCWLLASTLITTCSATSQAATWTNDTDYIIFFLGGSPSIQSPVNPIGGRVITDVNVSLNLQNYNWPSLQVSLSNGTTDVVLSNFGQDGGPSVNGTYVLGDEFTDIIGSGDAGNYRPQNPLSVFNGQTEDGTWSLNFIGGCCPVTPANLYSWSLIISSLASDQDYVSSVIGDIITGDVRQLIGTLDDRMTASWGGGLQPAAYVQNPFKAGPGETTGGLWARVNVAKADGMGEISGLGTLNNASYEEDSSFFQGGGSFTITNSAESRLIGSIFAHYLVSNADIDGAAGQAGNLSTKGLGAGGSLSWLLTNGFYTDFTALMVDHAIDVRTAGGQTGKANALTLATSGELGFSFDLGGGLKIVPQVQSVYQHVSIDGFENSSGIFQDFQDNDSLEGRAGVNIEFENPSATEQQVKFNLGANFVHEFLGSGTAVVAGSPLNYSGSDGSSLLLVGGATVTPLGDGVRFGVHGNYEMPLQNDGRKSLGASATVGWVW